jgi:hypothetical protein
MRNSIYFTDHSFDPENARVAEHETMLSFTNDAGNYAFVDWWESEGLKLFELWVDSNLEELNSLY